MRFFFAILFVLGLALPLTGLARIGVGVGLGTLRVEEPLKPGQIYRLPPLPVINTGTETADYRVAIEYHADRAEFRPEREWFSFEPALFTLDRGEIQMVTPVLTLPLKAKPGEYFAFLSAQSVKPEETGDVKITVAAASKFYFSVIPANLLQALQYRLQDLYEQYKPWSLILPVLIGLAVLLLILRRFVSLNIGVRRKEEYPTQLPYAEPVSPQPLPAPARKRKSTKKATLNPRVSKAKKSPNRRPRKNNA